MLPGPVLTLACPHCEARFRLRTLASGNTVGAIVYSDGLMEAPMLPRRPDLHVCRGCGKAFWIRDAAELEAVPPGGSTPSSEAGELPFAELPTAEDYRLALAQGLAANPEEELGLRLEWWWAQNDGERRGPRDGPPPERSDAYEANLARLAELLDQAEPSHRLFLAEMDRLRGRFEEARGWLDAEFPPELHGAAEAMKAMVDRGSRRVQPLNA